MFSMSVHTIQESCGKSRGEEERSSRMGTSELSSTLQSMFGSEQGSFPGTQRSLFSLVALTGNLKIRDGKTEIMVWWVLIDLLAIFFLFYIFSAPLIKSTSTAYTNTAPLISLKYPVRKSRKKV